MTVSAKVKKFIRDKKLLSGDEVVLVALSGGADSVALLHILKGLGCRIMALHCNFHLRGEESDRDESFVRTLAKRLGIEIRCRDFDTFAYAKEKKCSVEMAARELRYDWFESVAGELENAVIAVGHHRDDSVETILLNLIRGTGIRGLTGISPKRENIIRPLLTLSRQEIEEYLEKTGEEYVTDRTNLEDEYTRNKIRLNLIPLMESINPSLKDSILHMAGNLEEPAAFLQKTLEQEKEKVMPADNVISISALHSAFLSRMLLYEILKEFHFNRSQAESVYSALEDMEGKVFFSSTHRLLKERNCLLLEPLQEDLFAPVIIEKGERDTGDAAGKKMRLQVREVDIAGGWILPKSKNHIALDADKIVFPLQWRLWKEGDRFQPLGMKGKKKLSDYFTDAKFTRKKKEEATVLCSGDEIIWLVGERPDHRYRVTERTQKVIEIILIDN